MQRQELKPLLHHKSTGQLDSRDTAGNSSDASSQKQPQCRRLALHCKGGTSDFIQAIEQLKPGTSRDFLITGDDSQEPSEGTWNWRVRVSYGGWCESIVRTPKI